MKRGVMCSQPARTEFDRLRNTLPTSIQSLVGRVSALIPAPTLSSFTPFVARVLFCSAVMRLDRNCCDGGDFDARWPQTGNSRLRGRKANEWNEASAQLNPSPWKKIRMVLGKCRRIFYSHMPWRKDNLFLDSLQKINCAVSIFTS